MLCCNKCGNRIDLENDRRNGHCKDCLIDELLEACRNALGAYDALAACGADKVLPGYAGCLNSLKQVVAKAK